jgi:acyl-[acyl-carrier-protein]-phospholipid O-acyltransferase/long-chain-fatty-acid--[acyl-carrier-protein] ligase
MTPDQKPTSLLTSRRLWPLCLSQACGAFDDNLLKNALVVLAAFRLGNAGASFAALAGALFILPYLLLSATGGQIADRYAKRSVILWVKAAEIPLMLCAAAGFITGNVPALLATLFGIGVQAALFGPMKYGILPEHLREDELVSGNAIIEAATFLSILTGTVGGTLALLPRGPEIVSASGLLSSIAGLGAAFLIPRTKPADPALRVGWNIFGETWAVVQTARPNRRAWLSILGLSWFWAVGATLIAEFPALARDTLGSSGQVVSLMLGVFAAGVGGGSMLASRLLRGEVSARHVPFAALGMSLFCWDLGHGSLAGAHLAGIGALLAAPVGWRVLADLFALAACGGLFSVPLNAILQDAAPVASRARMIAANNIINAAFIIIAAIAVALVSAAGLSAPLALEILAAANFAVVVMIVRKLPNAFLRPFFQAYFCLFHRVRVTGIEHYRAAGDRVVIVSNHLSYIDALLISTFLPDSPSFAIHTHQMRSRLIRLATSTVRVFQVDISNPFAIRRMIEAVRDHGEKLVVFPEGRISQTGAMMKIFDGAAMVADKAGASIVPVTVDGTQFTLFSQMHGKLRLRWFPPLRLTIHPAISITPDGAADISPRARREAVGRALHDLMVETSFRAKDISKSLVCAFLEARGAHGGKSLILEDINREPMSFDRVLLGAAALGRKLAAVTQPSACIGVMLPNANANLVTLLGLSAFGRVPAMLNFSAGPAAMLSACAAAQVTQVISSRAFIEKAKLDSAVKRMAQDISFIWLEDVRATIGAKDKLRAKRDQLLPRRLPGASAAPDSAAIVLFTSGSEGVPKGVVLSHRNILANCAQLAAIIDFNPTDRVFNALPMFHALGLVSATLLPVLAGVRTFLYPSPLHYRIVPAMIYDTDATICFGTDTFLRGWAKYAHAYDFYAMRYIFAGAERVQDDTKRLFAERFGVRVFEGYGTTETAPVLAMNTAMHSKSGSVGRGLPGIDMQIDPVPGIAAGGMLSVRGPNVMLGYLRATAPGVLEPPPGDWYQTGDIVDVDTGGFLSITGRAKRFAKIAGEMLSMTAAEALAASVWPEDQHAVLAIPDARKGEAMLLLTTRAHADPRDLMAHARAQGLADIAVPRAIATVPAIPLLGSGKVDYQALQALAGADNQAPVAQLSSISSKVWA